MKKIFLVKTIVMITLLALTSLNLTPVLTTVYGNSIHAETTSEYPEWQLNVTGFVNNPLNLEMVDLVAMPQTSVYAELVCVDHPNQTILVGNWTGIKIQYLLESAGISPQAVKVGFYAIDNYSTDLTIEAAMHEDVILAYELNGEPLDEVLRLVVPGKWGYKWIHHVNRIELFSHNFLGYWEGFGYSDEANIDVPSAPKNVFTTIYPDTIPEFTSILPLAIAVILISFFAIIRRRFYPKNDYVS